MSTFRLAHLSDPHLPPPAGSFRWRDAASKRLLSRFAWRRKQHRHRPDVLEAITADVRAAAPDHVAVTGDLTNFATPEEFAAAAAWLERLAPEGALTVSPGNHDALVAAGAPERFAPWRRWLGDGEGDSFPHLRVRGHVALVNLCSATPTAPHLAQGSLGAGQLERLAEILRRTGDEGLYRVLMVHHPVTPGVVSGRKALTDARALQEVLAAVGAELVLHGHAHEAVFRAARGPKGPIPVLGVPSASVPPGGHDAPARWHAIDITRTPDGFATRVTARGIAEGLAVEELGAYEL